MDPSLLAVIAIGFLAFGAISRKAEHGTAAGS
jgi:hypothetical protein